ncbi:MAG TPA: hypothetical protein VI461_11275 [Chitinophagaceae bacterium]|nr:hypothetical protein [Chitinophagaceae bacterium]
MKKAYIFYLLLPLVFSCTKAKDFYEELGQGSYLTLVRQNNGLLNAVDPNSTVGQVVSSYGQPVESINLYASATATVNKANWKLIKSIPFSGETTIAATNTEIATALGLTPGALAPGSVFHLYNEAVLKDGAKFSSANTSDIDLENQAPFNIAFHFTATVVCPYDPATIAGTYTVVRDDWADWGVGDMVDVVAGAGANQVDLSSVWPNPAFGTVVAPFTITVDPATGTATIPSGVTWGNYGGFLAITDPGSTGFVFSCTGQISLRVNIKGQGFFQLILQK